MSKRIKQNDGTPHKISWHEHVMRICEDNGLHADCVDIVLSFVHLLISHNPRAYWDIGDSCTMGYEHNLCVRYGPVLAAHALSPKSLLVVHGKTQFSVLSEDFSWDSVPDFAFRFEHADTVPFGGALIEDGQTVVVPHADLKLTLPASCMTWYSNPSTTQVISIGTLATMWKKTAPEVVVYVSARHVLTKVFGKYWLHKLEKDDEDNGCANLNDTLRTCVGWPICVPPSLMILEADPHCLLVHERNPKEFYLHNPCTQKTSTDFTRTLARISTCPGKAAMVRSGNLHIIDPGTCQTLSTCTNSLYFHMQRIAFSPTGNCLLMRTMVTGGFFYIQSVVGAATTPVEVWCEPGKYATPRCVVFCGDSKVAFISDTHVYFAFLYEI
jgi:hypothetical protein